jgi:hypothetical protein
MHHPEECLHAASIVYFIDEAFFDDRRLFRTCLKEWADDPFAVLMMNLSLSQDVVAVAMFVFIDDLLESIVEMIDNAFSGGNMLV